MSDKKLSLIVPVYNEEESIEMFLSNVDPIMRRILNKDEYEYIFINDGSFDNSLEILLNLNKKRNDINSYSF